MDVFVPMNSLSHYRGRKVFLTGHTGFKGSWMLGWLALLGARVKGYALAPQGDADASLYASVGGDALCESVIADIRDRDRVRREIEAFQPDVVFHLAAQPLVRQSYEIPTETFDANVMGTVHVLDALRGLQRPCAAVMITTDKVYENREWPCPYRESDALGRYDPYSASKAAAEIVIAAYRSSYFNPAAFARHGKAIASARAGNVIGGGDWSRDRIVPDVVRALRQGLPVQVRHPGAVRPWQHVLEPLGGYLLLGARLAADPARFAESWNFGPAPDDTFTVEELVRTAIKVWGAGRYETPHQAEQPHEAQMLQLDISKTVSRLGWQPRLRSREAIEWTLAFYRAMDAAQELRAQVTRYMDRCGAAPVLQSPRARATTPVTG